MKNCVLRFGQNYHSNTALWSLGVCKYYISPTSPLAWWLYQCI